MKPQEIKINYPNSKYSIIIGNNVLKLLKNKIIRHCPKTKKIALIFDKNVPSKYKKSIQYNLRK